jgi:hypothetical protein
MDKDCWQLKPTAEQRNARPELPPDSEYECAVCGHERFRSMPLSSGNQSQWEPHQVCVFLRLCETLLTLWCDCAQRVYYFGLKDALVDPNFIAALARGRAPPFRTGSLYK